MSIELYGWDPRDPTRYDLVVNTGRMDLDACVEIIVEGLTRVELARADAERAMSTTRASRCSSRRWRTPHSRTCRSPASSATRCGDAGCNIAFQMTGLFLLIFYTDVVGINPVHAGNIFLFVKIWDAFADLFAGRMVDRTMTRWGKFRPFLLWYSVPLLAANLLCFWIPVDGYGAKLAWATVSYALLGLLYSLVNIPYGSLAGAMSQNPIDRSRLASAPHGRLRSDDPAARPRPRPADQGLATTSALTFLVTAVVFLVVGTVLFLITFLTARETVVRDVAQVSLKQTLQTVRQNGPLVRLCLSSFFYLTGQNVISALGIYIANDILSQYAGGNWLATRGHHHHHRRGPLRRPVRAAGHPRARQEARLHHRRAWRAIVGCVVFFVSGNLIFALRRACSSSASAWPC